MLNTTTVTQTCQTETEDVPPAAERPIASPVQADNGSHILNDTLEHLRRRRDFVLKLRPAPHRVETRSFLQQFSDMFHSLNLDTERNLAIRLNKAPDQLQATESTELDENREPDGGFSSRDTAGASEVLDSKETSKHQVENGFDELHLIIDRLQQQIEQQLRSIPQEEKKEFLAFVGKAIGRWCMHACCDVRVT